MLTEEERLEAVQLVKDIYKEHCAGCCCHIVLDDGNIGNGSVEFCSNYAKKNECTKCIRMCELLSKMKKTQRLKMGTYA
jgi:hypothetical protein